MMQCDMCWFKIYRVLKCYMGHNVTLVCFLPLTQSEEFKSVSFLDWTITHYRLEQRIFSIIQTFKKVFSSLNRHSMRFLGRTLFLCVENFSISSHCFNVSLKSFFNWFWLDNTISQPERELEKQQFPTIFLKLCYEFAIFQRAIFKTSLCAVNKIVPPGVS